MSIVLHATAGPNQGHTVTFDRHDTFVVGRSDRAAVRLPHKDPYLSRYHFLLEVNPPLCRVMDLGSRNGTFVNGQRAERADLQDGDLLKAGHTVFRIEVDSGGDQTLTRAPSENAAGPVRTDLPEIPGYRIMQEVGRGGMGAVYEAIHEGSDTTVALKVISSVTELTPVQAKRFLREVGILQQLNHPNVVRFLDSGETNGQLWFAMEHVRGMDASKRVKRRGPMTVKAAIGVTVRILRGLDHAHRLGFVHRDVKPPNVLLALGTDGKPQVKLADFGLARAYDESQLSGLTLTGDVGGTPSYMPPEQVLDFRNVGPQADVYSAAATLYFLLTGRQLYEAGRDPVQIIAMVLDADPIPIARRRPDLPPGLAEVIHRALAKEPSGRPAGALSFARQLEPYAR